MNCLGFAVIRNRLSGKLSVDASSNGLAGSSRRMVRNRERKTVKTVLVPAERFELSNTCFWRAAALARSTIVRSKRVMSPTVSTNHNRLASRRKRIKVEPSATMPGFASAFRCQRKGLGASMLSSIRGPTWCFCTPVKIKRTGWLQLLDWAGG